MTTKAGGLRPVRVTIDQKRVRQRAPDEAIVTDATGGLANAVVTLVGVKASATITRGRHHERKVSLRAARADRATKRHDHDVEQRPDPSHDQRADSAARVLFNVAVPVPGIKINEADRRAWPRATGLQHAPLDARLDCRHRRDRRRLGRGRQFTLTNVPAGTYELRVWHESLKGASQKVTVTAGQTTSIQVTLQ